MPVKAGEVDAKNAALLRFARRLHQDIETVGAIAEFITTGLPRLHRYFAADTVNDPAGRAFEIVLRAVLPVRRFL